LGLVSSNCCCNMAQEFRIHYWYQKRIDGVAALLTVANPKIA